MWIGDSSTLASLRGRSPATSSMIVQLLLPRMLWWIQERYVMEEPFQSAQNSLASGHWVLPPMYCAQAFQESSFLYQVASIHSLG
ncbi:hypothetical protein GCM10027203_07990 [Nonomuraea fastidiosa]